MKTAGSPSGFEPGATRSGRATVRSVSSNQMRYPIKSWPAKSEIVDLSETFHVIDLQNFFHIGIVSANRRDTCPNPAAEIRLNWIITYLPWLELSNHHLSHSSSLSLFLSLPSPDSATFKKSLSNYACNGIFYTLQNLC